VVVCGVCGGGGGGVGVSAVVLQIVGEGLHLTLLSPPVEDNCQLLFTANQLAWLAVELCWLKEAQAIKWMGKGALQPVGIVLVSLVFLVPKRGPKLW
jgi:hypothetical protein